MKMDRQDSLGGEESAVDENPHQVAGLLDYQVEAQLRGCPTGGQGEAARLWFDHPELTRYVHKTIVGPKKEIATVALTDWTTLYHVAALFEGKPEEVDPFVALADLSSMVAAALFYDRVVVINGEPHIHVVQQAFNMDETLVSLRTDAFIAPGEQRCLCLFEAAGPDQVRSVSDIAQFPLARVVAGLSSVPDGTSRMAGIGDDMPDERC